MELGVGCLMRCHGAFCQGLLPHSIRESTKQGAYQQCCVVLSCGKGCCEGRRIKTALTMKLPVLHQLEAG